MKKNIKKVIIFCGIYMFPLWAMLFCTLFYQFYSALYGSCQRLRWIIPGCFMAAIICFFKFCQNIYRMLIKRKKCFSSFREYFFEEEYSLERVQAMFPPIHRKYIANKPKGIVLAEEDGKYLCLKPDSEIVHTNILGASGAGKSTGPFLCSLIPNFVDSLYKKPPLTFVVLDVKPELAYKSVEIIGNPYVRVLNPADRMWTSGWDVYYGLDERSTEDEVVSELTVIAGALIMDANEKNAFFVDNARNILIGMLLYYFKLGKGFVESIDLINSIDVKTHIENITKDHIYCPPKGRVMSFLGSYKGIESKAYDDIKMQLKTNLAEFGRNDVKWVLRDAPLKTNPKEVDNGISLFLSIKESDLAVYKNLFRLIVSQILSELMKRDERNAYLNRVVLMLDEFPSLGKMEQILSTMRLGRSKKVSIMVCYQDFNALEAIYGHHDAKQILNLARCIVCLSCEDEVLGKILSDRAGEFLEKKESYTVKGFWSTTESSNISYQPQKVIRIMKDFSSLLKRKEVIVFIDGQYYRANKVQYFCIPELEKRSKNVQRYNDISQERCRR